VISLFGGRLIFAVHPRLCEYMLVPSACCTFDGDSLANQHYIAHIAPSNNSLLLTAPEF